MHRFTPKIRVKQPVRISPAQSSFAAVIVGYISPYPTVANVTTLKSRGVIFVGPDDGLLSCGYEGIGRLSAPDYIVQQVLKAFK